MTPNYVPGFGNPSAKLLICAEAPGSHENEHPSLGPLTGPSGHLLDELLTNAGIHRNECYLTNVIKYQPPLNDLKRLKEVLIDGKPLTLESQIPQLHEEIKAINPNAILALGNLALETLTGRSGISNFRGSILEYKDHVYPKVISTLHPANLLPGRDYVSYSARAYVQLDINRAVEESKTREFNLPNRILQIIKTSNELEIFLSTYRSYNEASADIETHHGIPVCISLCFIPSHSISIPLLCSTGLVVSSELVKIYLILAKLFKKIKIIGQNWKFDHEKLEKISRLGTTQLSGDTMFLQHCINTEFPKSLAFITSIYTREPYYKDEGKEWDPRKDKIEKLLLYNCKDSAVTLEAHQKMMVECKEKGLESFYRDYLLKLHPIYLDIERRGIKVDHKRREELTTKYKDLYSESQESLNSLVGKKVNCNSPKQIRELLYGQLGLPIRVGVDEETLVALYANNAKLEIQRTAIDYILNIRRYRKTLGTYLEAQLDYDGRMRTSYNIVGTETGRRSTTVLKQPIRPEKLGTSLLTWTKHGDIGSDIRSFLIPDEGYEFIEVDLSQAEARIALLYADDEESLTLFDTVDFHKWTAARCFNTSESLITNDQRFVGKTTRYLRQYYGSKRRLMQTINTDSRRFHIGCSKTDEYKCNGKHVSLSEWKCGEILNTFDRFTPKLQTTFHRAVREQLLLNRTFENCFGRKRTFFERFDDELLRSAFAHSCSSVVADHVGRSLISLYQELPSFQVQVEFHDAIFGQAKKEEVTKAAKSIKEILERKIDFTKGSIKRRLYSIPAEIMIGDNWKDMKKVKV